MWNLEGHFYSRILSKCKRGAKYQADLLGCQENRKDTKYQNVKKCQTDLLEWKCEEINTWMSEK